MKTAVDKVLRGNGCKVNERFEAMCCHYLFETDFCNVVSGWEKGIVEKNVHDRRRQILVEVGNQGWDSPEQVNTWGADRCRTA